jgi:hypothetical protein
MVTKEHKESPTLNHNLAKLYEEVKMYELAIVRYKFLISFYGDYNYYEDIANIYQRL